MEASDSDRGDKSRTQLFLVLPKEARDKLRLNPKTTLLTRGNVMIKSGDMFKNVQSGEVFRVRSVNPRSIILATKDESHSMFVNPNSMESVFLPFVEDEAKRKPQ